MSNSDTQRETDTYAFSTTVAEDLNESAAERGLLPVEVSGDAIATLRHGGIEALVKRLTDN